MSCPQERWFSQEHCFIYKTMLLHYWWCCQFSFWWVFFPRLKYISLVESSFTTLQLHWICQNFAVVLLVQYILGKIESIPTTPVLSCDKLQRTLCSQLLSNVNNSAQSHYLLSAFLFFFLCWASVFLLVAFVLFSAWTLFLVLGP